MSDSFKIKHVHMQKYMDTPAHKHTHSLIISTGVGISQQLWKRETKMTHGLRLCLLRGKPKHTHGHTIYSSPDKGNFHYVHSRQERIRSQR